MGNCWLAADKQLGHGKSDRQVHNQLEQLPLEQDREDVSLLFVILREGTLARAEVLLVSFGQQTGQKKDGKAQVVPSCDQVVVVKQFVF